MDRGYLVFRPFEGKGWPGAARWLMRRLVLHPLLGHVSVLRYDAEGGAWLWVDHGGARLHVRVIAGGPDELRRILLGPPHSVVIELPPGMARGRRWPILCWCCTRTAQNVADVELGAIRPYSLARQALRRGGRLVVGAAGLSLETAPDAAGSSDGWRRRRHLTGIVRRIRADDASRKPQTSSSTVTGTWSEGPGQPRASRRTSAATRPGASAGESQTWSSRRPRSEASQSRAR